jgi:hypothetical protein
MQQECEMAHWQTTRNVTLSGTRSEIKQAKRLIEQHISQRQPRASGMGGGAPVQHQTHGYGRGGGAGGAGAGAGRVEVGGARGWEGGYGDSMRSAETGGGASGPGMGPGAAANDRTQMLVPTAHVGLLIGRGGETIRRLREQSGASINMSREPSEQGEHITQLGIHVRCLPSNSDHLQPCVQPALQSPQGRHWLSS